MIWDIYQQRKIWDNEQQARDANTKVDRQANSVSKLQRDNERLTLACQAMWELLRDHLGFTDEHLEAKILEVDGRDGTVDGKISVQTFNCHACGHKTNSNRQTCVMCGVPVKRPNIF